MRKCPHCKGIISETARKCKHCGEWVISMENDTIKEEIKEEEIKEKEVIKDETKEEVIEEKENQSEKNEKEDEKPSIKKIIITFIVGTIILLLGYFINNKDKIINDFMEGYNEGLRESGILPNEMTDDEKFHDYISEEDGDKFLKIAAIYPGFNYEEIDLDASNLKNPELIRATISKIEENKRLIDISIKSFEDFGNEHKLRDKNGFYSYNNFNGELNYKYQLEIEYFDALIEYYNYVLTIQNKFTYNKKNGYLYVDGNDILNKINELEEKKNNAYENFSNELGFYQNYINRLFETNEQRVENYALDILSYVDDYRTKVCFYEFEPDSRNIMDDKDCVDITRECAREDENHFFPSDGQPCAIYEKIMTGKGPSIKKDYEGKEGFSELSDKNATEIARKVFLNDYNSYSDSTKSTGAGKVTVIKRATENINSLCNYYGDLSGTDFCTNMESYSKELNRLIKKYKFELLDMY